MPWIPLTVEDFSGCKPGATIHQVMSRPSEGGEQPVMEGEASGPNYGAMNGVAPASGTRRTGASSAMPLGRIVAGSGSQGQPSGAQQTAQEVRFDVTDGPTTSTLGARTRLVEQNVQAEDVGQGRPTGPVVDFTASGATLCDESTTQQPRQEQQQVTSTTSATPIATVAPPPPPPPQPLRDPETIPMTPRERFRPPLQQAVQQLSQQRAAVVQAVQTRAQRALHSVRGEDLFSSAESLVGSPPAALSQEDGPREASSWSVTRISEVLHRRLVAPVLGHVGGADRVMASSPPWQSPVNDNTGTQSLMSPETRQAMASWTAQPTPLTLPVAERAPRDDSSAGSVNREAVMEEVKRQVQLAMQSRDMEVRTLKDQNDELRRALDASAQLLNDVMQTGGGAQASSSQGAMHGPSGFEPGGNPAGADGGGRRQPSAPPGLEEVPHQPGRNPSVQGRGEPFVLGNDRRATGQDVSIEGKPRLRDHQTGGPYSSGSLDEGHLQGTPAIGGVEPSPLDLLVQGMQQLQQVYMDKKSTPEAENMKGSVDLPSLPDLVGETGAEFSDWLYVAEQIVGSLSDSAAMWFKRTLQSAKEAYIRHQAATPMERLTIVPVAPPDFADVRWSRLERKVMTMLLTAMPKSVKEDAVTHRVATVCEVMFRLHVLYAPGGNAERAALLKQLEGTPGGENVIEVIANLRRWRRNLTRALEMNIVPPDPSVLLRGLESMTGAAVRKHHDVSFRLALARTELQLYNRPSQETILKYYDHILAELQQTAPMRALNKGSNFANDEQPRLKAVDGQAGTGGTSVTSPSGSPAKKAGTPCKFFASDSGCRRGSGCKDLHDFSSKEDKRSRCWFCGSKQHRQGECPVKDPSKASRQAAPSSAESSSARPVKPSPTVAVSIAPEPKATGPMASSTASTVTSSTTSSEHPVQAEVVQPFTPEALQNPELQTFMKEVNTMLQRFSRLNQLSVGCDDDLNAKIKKMESEMLEPGDAGTSWALLDSGATNAYRPAAEGEEQMAMPVQVQLADGKSVLLRQNRAGTLLPYSKKQAKERGQGTVIVPLGSLVQELGCSVNWTRRGLEVIHPVCGVLTTHVSGACPFIGEARALELIGELENRKLEQLKVSMLETQLRLCGIEAQRTYGIHLAEYRRTGDRAKGLQALMCEDSAFGCLTESQRCALAQDIDLSDKAGHRYLKALPVKRAMRRRLMSTQWLVHLYSGQGGSAEFRALEDNCVTLLEIDLGISKAFNMREPSAAYKALLWAAMRGQLYGLVGAPPRNEGCDELVQKQMFLWNVAKTTAEEHEVQQPIFAMTMPLRSVLWGSPMWKRFRDALEVKVSCGGPEVMLATNLLVKDAQYDDLWEQPSKTGEIVWTPELRGTLVRAIHRHRTSVALRRLDGPLSSMTKEELAKWTQHVKNGHLPYNKRCQTCVASRATGHQHRRIEAPSCYVMSLDVCGPFRVKGHTPEAMDNRYMLVASYVMPALKGHQCEPGDEIINEPEAGVGEIADSDGVLPGGPTADSDGVLPGGPSADSDGVLPGGPSADSDGVLPGGPSADSDGVLPGGPSADSDGVLPGGPNADSDGVLPGGPEDSPPGHEQDVGDSIDLESLFAEEEDQMLEPVKESEQQEWDRLNQEYNDLVAEVGDVMNYQVLRFAVPMRSRRSAEVNQRVRQLYLQIRAEGFPVLRCHSDRARELCNSRLRTWLTERGVLVTTGEAQAPQQNGRAESTVKFVKNEAKSLLTAAKLGKENWPLAMRYAVHRQRHRILGKEEPLYQFGCPVFVRTKVYGRAERYDLDNKWQQGIYVGPSEDIAHGYVVKFQDNTFVTSQHMKANLVDTDSLVDTEAREVVIPLPERRLREKSRLAVLSHGQPLSPEELRAESFAKDICRKEQPTAEDVMQLLVLFEGHQG